MTTGASTNEGAIDAWRAVRDDPDIQFEPIAPPDAPDTPDWLLAVGDFLAYVFGFVARGFVFAWPVLQWVLIAAGIALLVLLPVLYRGSRIIWLNIFVKYKRPEERAKQA